MFAKSRHGRHSRTAFYSIMAFVVLANAGTPADDKTDRDVIVVRGTSGKPQHFTVEDLRKLSRTEIEATDRKGQKVKYAGVAVSVLLEKVGTAQGEKLRGEWMRAFVTVDARDEYRAVFALAEFDADFTDRVIILAYERDGQPLDPQAGPLQIIVPGEKKHARRVRMVKEIRVLDSAWIKE
jgi:DMSO/TMAO reductase YedYZ molybdopterin-dependent catalytic subunit